MDRNRREDEGKQNRACRETGGFLLLKCDRNERQREKHSEMGHKRIFSGG